MEEREIDRLGLNHIETEIDKMRSMIQEELREIRTEIRTEIRVIKTEIRGIRTGNRSNFKWLLGVILCTVIPMWVSVILTILFK